MHGYLLLLFLLLLLLLLLRIGAPLPDYGVSTFVVVFVSEAMLAMIGTCTGFPPKTGTARDRPLHLGEFPQGPRAGNRPLPAAGFGLPGSW